MQKSSYILIGVILFVVLIGAWFYLAQPDYIEPPSSAVDIPAETGENQMLAQNQQNDTVEWITYRNKKYGYEIRYPITWNTWDESNTKDLLQGDEDGIGLGIVDAHFIDILVYEKKDDPFSVNLSEMYISGFGAQSKPDIIGSYEEINVSGEKAKSFKILHSKSCTAEYVRIERKSYVYWIFTYCENDIDGPHELFPEILSTFKFIESE